LGVTFHESSRPAELTVKTAETGFSAMVTLSMSSSTRETTMGPSHTRETKKEHAAVGQTQQAFRERRIRARSNGLNLLGDFERGL
jgi:hypothetical protein